MKKKNLIFAAAMSAVMAMSVTAAPCAYAIKDTAVTEAAEDEQAEESNKLEFKTLNKFSSHKSGKAIAADSDGTVYYWGSDRNGSEFFTADKEGNVLNSYRIDDYDDGGLTIGVMNAEMKILDDCVLLMYEKCVTNKMMMGNKGCALVKLDKELNEISKCDVGKCREFDSNGENIVILKGSKIYLTDMNGKNKKLVYTVNGENGVDYVYYAAISDTHIGFGGGGGLSPNAKNYIGVIDIETGEVTVKQQERRIMGVEAMNNSTLVWKSYEAYDVKVDDGNPNHHIYGLGYYDDREYYLFDGKQFDTFTAENTYENLIIDSDGNFITYDSYMKNDNAVLRIYKDGKVADKFNFTDSDDGFVTLAANGGFVAVCTVAQSAEENTNWGAYELGDAMEYHEPLPINVTIIKYSE